MKHFNGKSIKELRKILGLTQESFAALIGSTKDTIASWETTRNEVSPGMAWRISMQTGVEQKSLLEWNGKLKTRDGRQAFTKEDYEKHQKRFWGGGTEQGMEKQLVDCKDALDLLVRASIRGKDGVQARARLAGVVNSFIQWCQQTREDYELEKPIDELLSERKTVLELNKTYRQWREMAKQDPDAARAMGFKNDPTMDERESLRLTMEGIPVWKPGYRMGRPKAP